MGNPNPSPTTRFQPGNPGGGRRKKLLATVDEKLKEANVHPVDELLKLYERVGDRDKIKIMTELLAYCQAKPREDAAEETDSDSPHRPIQILTTEQLLRLVQATTPQLEEKK